ncbi:MAG TPA: FkbM family methyltransferase [Bacteroidales bacterium]|nr:FkbM family methyltransferase [Bacteroidales bacterium]HPT22035.1 FkbM family methyltransferase [Bacteroidales bacterium]
MQNTKVEKLNCFKRYLIRRKARRVTQEYPAVVNSFDLKDEGKVEFAVWSNPLAPVFSINQEMVDFFKKFVKKGDLVIDIGANIGDTTILMALAAGKSGTVLGFEPNPFIFKILTKNASFNTEKQNIVPLPYAVTVKEEEFFYISSEASFANGGISPTKESRHGKFIYPDKVKGKNLEELLDKDYSDKLKDFSLVKIDTEGYDKEIIKSISGLIDKCKPVIIAESFKHNTPEQKMELYEVISRHGYEIFYFEDFNIKAKVVKLEKSSDITNYKETINIYAVPVKKQAE